MSGRPLLEASNLEVYYGETRALWDVSFKVEEGELAVLLGSNGAGKTTSLRTVQGVLKPRRGRVAFRLREISGLRADRVTSLGISLVPEGRGLFTRMTVEENLDLGAFTKRARGKINDNREFVYDLFPILKERRGQRAGLLSGGEQQMLAIGRGLMSNPELLMLDEPSLGLAPVVASKVFEVLGELREKTGITILLVEQNIEAALAIANRAYLLDTGRVIFEGKPEEFRANASLRESYLGL